MRHFSSSAYGVPIYDGDRKRPATAAGQPEMPLRSLRRTGASDRPGPIERHPKRLRRRHPAHRRFFRLFARNRRTGLYERFDFVEQRLTAAGFPGVLQALWQSCV